VGYKLNIGKEFKVFIKFQFYYLLKALENIIINQVSSAHTLLQLKVYFKSFNS